MFFVKIDDSFPYLEDGAELANDGHPAHAKVLADRDLEQEEWDAAGQHGQEVGDQKRT